MNQIQTAVILVGEYNPLIEVCGSAILTRQILRCYSLGIEQVYVFGHLSPTTLDYLRQAHAAGPLKVIFEFAENPWVRVSNENKGKEILVISCEHLTDIHLLKEAISYQTGNLDVLMFGEPKPTEISTVRPRILLSQQGTPLDLLDRAKSEAVWMGLAILHMDVLALLAQRKGEISHITLKQAGMLVQYGTPKLIKIDALFWDRIEASRIGANISQEILFYSNQTRSPFGIWESGISHVITNVFNYSASSIFPLYLLLVILSLWGGWYLSTLDPFKGLIGLVFTLMALLVGRSIQEIQSLNSLKQANFISSQILAIRLSALAIFCGLYYTDHSTITFKFDRKMLNLLAMILIVIVSLGEITKHKIFCLLELSPLKYENAKRWQKYFLNVLNLHWLWYLYPIFYAFNLFQTYFSLFIIEMYFLYLIFLLQLPHIYRLRQTEVELK